MYNIFKKIKRNLLVGALAFSFLLHPYTVSPEEKSASIKEIPILMYHNIASKDKNKNNKNSRYYISPENFRKQLEELYANGFVAIKLEDLVNNQINVEEGKKPVVLSFDDSKENQFRINEYSNGDTDIDKNCAVGILLDFYNKQPEFGKNAMFFVIAKDCFGQEKYKKQKLEFLLANGMEIGNHTYNHPNLMEKSADFVENNLGKAMEKFYEYLGEDASKIKILAVPGGHFPKSKEAMEKLIKFSYHGKNYENTAIIGAGGGLCPLPTEKKFDKYKIPRIEVRNDNFEKILEKIK